MSGKWKSTIIIWSDFDPWDANLSYLAEQADSGDAICVSDVTTFVPEPESDPDYAGAREFFDEDWS